MTLFIALDDGGTPCKRFALSARLLHLHDANGGGGGGGELTTSAPRRTRTGLAFVLAQNARELHVKRFHSIIIKMRGGDGDGRLGRTGRADRTERCTGYLIVGRARTNARRTPSAKRVKWNCSCMLLSIYAQRTKPESIQNGRKDRPHTRGR